MASTSLGAKVSLPTKLRFTWQSAFTEEDFFLNRPTRKTRITYDDHVG